MRKLIALVALALPLGFASPAQAAIVVNHIFPLTSDQSNAHVLLPCTGEWLTLEGQAHFLLTFTTNDNRSKGTSTFQTLRAVGTDSAGRTYRVVEVTGDQSSFDVARGEYVEVTLHINVLILGPSGGPSYMLHLVYHQTIDGSGRVTSEFLRERATCR